MELYRPSTGTEGVIFEDIYCLNCTKEEKCDIIHLSMSYEIDEPEYPKQMTYDKEMTPICTEFDKCK